MLPAITARLVLSTLVVALPLSAPSNAVAAEDHNDSAYTTEDVSFQNDGLTLHGTVLVPSTPGRGDHLDDDQAFHRGASSRRRDRGRIGGSRAFRLSRRGPSIRRIRRGHTHLRQAHGRLLAHGTLVRTVGRRRDRGASPVAGARPMSTRRVSDCGVTARAAGWCRWQPRRIPRVGFVIIAGASARPPAEVQTWSTCRYLVNSGFPEQLCAPVGGNLTRLMVAGGLFPEAAFDPLPALAQLRVPALVLLAEFDQSTAPVTSGRLFAETLSGSPDASVCVVPGADHEFRASPNGFEAAEGYADGYLQLAPTWVGALGGTSFDCPSAAPAQQVGYTHAAQPPRLVRDPRRACRGRARAVRGVPLLPDHGSGASDGRASAIESSSMCPHVSSPRSASSPCWERCACSAT